MANENISVKIVPLDTPINLTITEPKKATPSIVPAPGKTGLTGPKGDQGDQGIQGEPGPQGVGAEQLGVAGNNELEITGIENTTVVDSVDASAWRWIKYMVSISKTTAGVNKFYATELTILIDGDNINISESGVIDNDGDMGTISVSKNGGNLELIVTPDLNIRPITVRYARIGLKS